MNDERNFRASYLERLGCRSVDERKNLEILLKENPVNKIKLKNFCLRFVIPAGELNMKSHCKSIKSCNFLLFQTIAITFGNFC